MFKNDLEYPRRKQGGLLERKPSPMVKRCSHGQTLYKEVLFQTGKMSDHPDDWIYVVPCGTIFLFSKCEMLPSHRQVIEISRLAAAGARYARLSGLIVITIVEDTSS